MYYEEKTTKSERIYDGKIVNLRLDTVELPNMTYAHREIIEHDNCVTVIPFKDEDTLYMVRQYRKAVDEVLLEFPAGIVEEDEDPKQAALREMMEEIGYGANDLEYLTEIYPSPGYTNEKIDIFIAKDLYKSELEKDPDEFIEVVEVKLDELADMIESLDLQDAKTLVGVLYILSKRG